MELHLQKNRNKTFKVVLKGKMNNYTLLDNINGNVAYKQLVKLVIDLFACRKLILDF